MERREAFRLLAFGTRSSHSDSQHFMHTRTEKNFQQRSIKQYGNDLNCDSAETKDPASSIEYLSAIKLTSNYLLKDDNNVVDEPDRKKTKLKRSTVNGARCKNQKEIAQDIRNKNKIYVWGTDIPKPMETFDEIFSKLPSSFRCLIAHNLQTYSFSTPTPIQMQAIPVMIRRREILACAPTGSGKTIAFLLPTIIHLCNLRTKMQVKTPKSTRCLVLAPTRELAHQIYTVAKILCAKSGISISMTKCAKRLKKNSTKIRTDMLVSTPKRIVTLLKRKLLSLKKVRWLVVDESDKMFESGAGNMRDQLGFIYKACDNPKLRRAFFSATFSFEVEEWCKLNLDNVVTVGVGKRNSAVETVDQELKFVGDEYGKLFALKNALRGGLEAPILLFVQSKQRAEQLYGELLTEPYGRRVDVIHSDKTQEHRTESIQKFRAGHTFILICTELMGRGIDFKAVNVVINYDFPPSAISYIHRIGRTGRAGRPGKAITYFTEDDRVLLRSIANVMRTAGCDVPDYMLRLPKPDRKLKKLLAKKSVKRKSINADVSSTTTKRKKKVQQKKHHRKSSKEKEKQSAEEN